MVHTECTKSLEFKKVYKNEMPLEQMSSRLKPSYFERDGPVCTWSASSFCRNPLNFCTHVIWVKWWYHAKFQPFLSSFVDAFHFQGHLAQNKSLNAWKIANEVRKGSNFSMCLWMVHIECKKSFEKWNAFVRDEFSSKTLTLRKRWSSLLEVHPIFVVTLSTSAHMLYG